MSNVFHLVSKYSFCFMDPILSLGKESLKRLCFAGERGQRYSNFTPHWNWALSSRDQLLPVQTKLPAVPTGLASPAVHGEAMVMV